MNVPNVKLYLTTGGAASEAVLAPNYHIYIDLDPKAPGVMKHVRSDVSGTIVADPSSPSNASPSPGPKVIGSAVALDDSRTYNVIVSGAPLTTVPSVGVPAKVAGGKLSIPAHIAVRLTSDGTKPVGGAVCDLTIGSTATSIKSSSAGWIFSADRSAGAVTLAVKDKSIVTAGAAAPKAALTTTPPKPVRGDKAKIAISGPSGSVGFKVSEWKYEISHQNPGTASALTASVVRPTTENKASFGDFWEGILCASGTVKVKFGAGITLRASGDKPVSATVTVQDPAETSLAVTVEPRTGATWESGLVEKPEQPLVRAITSFHDTGEHKWDPSALKVDAAPAIAEGPNRGCTFVKAASITFTSIPSINSLITNAASAFSAAQDKAYLTSPAPVRVIPSHLYTVGAGGKITIKDNDAFAAWILGRPLKPGEGWSAKTSGHCIDQPRLLSGTQRHEYKDPDKSHKQNCLKARRALDPIKFGEALVQLPGKTINFLNLVNARVTAVINAAPIHDVIDETETQKAGALKFKAGEKILGVNSDGTGAVIGSVWNPTTNRELT
jgi:hypothetical protein